MILVTGASGTVGREVVAQLIAAGQRVRALARDPSKARAAVHRDAEVVQGDLALLSTLDAALQGVDRVFSLSTGPDIGAHEANLAAAAKRAGSTRVVKLSVIGAGSGSDNAIVRWHEAGEKAFRDSGLAWTFVRPAGFMSNALGWISSVKAQGKVFLPSGQGKMVQVHPRDIAAVSVAALTNEGHEGKSYTLTGGEALSAREMVAILSAVLAKPIEYVAMPEDVAREQMLQAGMPRVVVEALLQWTARARAGENDQPLPTVQQVLGRRPISWREWVTENAPAFS